MKGIRKSIGMMATVWLLVLSSALPVSAHDIRLSNSITGPGSRNDNHISIRQDIETRQELRRLRSRLRHNQDHLRRFDVRFNQFDLDRMNHRELRELDRMLDRILDRATRNSLRDLNDIERFFLNGNNFDFRYRNDVDIRSNIDIRPSAGDLRIHRNTVVGDISTGDVEIEIDISS